MNWKSIWILNMTLFALQVPLLKKLELRPVPIDQIEHLKELLNFTRSSYCLEGLQEWNCPTCTKELLVSDVRLVGEFHTHVFGFLAYSKKLNMVVVSFRGTRNIRNWIQDLKFAKPDHPFDGGPEGARVHYGFLEAWTFLKPEVFEGLNQLVSKYPNSKLLITGHSLGGAISTLCATELYLTYPALVS
jgi:hypothetical protein